MNWFFHLASIYQSGVEAAAAKSLQLCPTLCRPQRQQPTRLHRAWDSPGKNTGVGCHFLLQCMKEKSEREVAQSCPTLSDPMDCSLPGSSVHGIFPGKSTRVGCHFLLQCMKVKSESEVASVMSDPQRPHGLQPTRLLRPWDLPGKSIGVGCHCLLPGVEEEEANGFLKHKRQQHQMKTQAGCQALF